MRDYKLEERVGCILFLVCGAVVSVIGFWFPWHACKYHSAPDDRYGGAILLGLTMCLFGASITSRSALRLLRLLCQKPLTAANLVVGIGGGFLALAGLSPWLMLAWMLLSR